MSKRAYIVSSIIIVFAMIFISSKQNIKINQDVNATNKKIKVVTSFYPLYVAALNVIGEDSNIELSSLTQPQTGCLHDYQLTAEDMKSLEKADLLIVNGQGMESFLGDVSKQYPELQIINTTEGMESDLLEETHGHSHDEEDSDEHIHNDEHNHDDEHIHEEGEDHEEEKEYNAHVWTSFTLYMNQVQNICDAFTKKDETHTDEYVENAKQYKEKIKKLQQRYQNELADLKRKPAVIFHSAFAYLCKELDIPMISTIEIQSDTSFSALQIAKTIDEIKEENVETLIVDNQYSTNMPLEIKRETNAKLYALNSGVSGELNKDAYLNIMEKNLEILKGDTAN